MLNGTEMPLRTKICRSCEQCTKRKVRCVMGKSDSSRCVHCIKRDEPCQFRELKRKLKGSRRDSLSSSSQTVKSTPPSMHDDDKHLQIGVSTFFVDQMLDNHPVSGLPEGNYSILKAQGSKLYSLNLAYFSENRIASLTQRLGNNSIRSLLEATDTVIRNRLSIPNVQTSNFGRVSRSEYMSRDMVKLYTDAYFTHLHAVYPFLDREDFEKQINSPSLDTSLATNIPFCALYHAVLALGCQYHEGSAFDPGKGKAWRLFEISLSMIGDLVTPKPSLLKLQALVAMSIFTLNLNCLQVEEALFKQAALMAQSLEYNRFIANRVETDTCYRTFWVIFWIEKHTCFQTGNNSVIADFDIGCPIPGTPEAMFREYNWLLSIVRLGRIFSQAYQLLFSASATIKSTESLYAAVDHIRERLEGWRMAIPEEFRPDNSRKTSTIFSNSSEKLIFLYTQYGYHSLVIALARRILHTEASAQGYRCEESKKMLMYSARSVLELTRYIDTEAHIPQFILAFMPLVALFILFDFVVHNPTHPETRSNLSLLDVAAGHFSLLEYKSGGTLPTSLLSEFVSIARNYVKDFRPTEISSTYSEHLRQNMGDEVSPTYKHLLEGQPPFVQLTGPNTNQTQLGYEDSFIDPDSNWEIWDDHQEVLNYPSLDNYGESAEDHVMSGYDLRTLFGPIFPDFGSTQLEPIPEKSGTSLNALDPLLQ